MNIFLTFDYELYYGKNSGTAYKCLIEPTNRLIQIAEKHNIKLTFFIDCGYLFAMQNDKMKFKKVEKEYHLVSAQIRELVRKGHDCQLHIHPHWEDSYFDGDKWVMNTLRYKLPDFSEDEILLIFIKYKKVLEDLTGKTCNVYRAGGWCLQPFSKIVHAFKACNIRLDSTVFVNGYLDSGTHFYDFRNAPDKDYWKFSDDFCVEDKNGIFGELPISSFTYNPFFFWKLFGLGRIFRSRHKPIGNGSPISSKNNKLNYLMKSQRLPISCDGYFSSKLFSAYNNLKIENKKNMVVIGHPKATTLYSLNKLDKFIKEKKDDNGFLTLSDFLN